MTLWRLAWPWLLSFVIGEAVAVPVVMFLERVLPQGAVSLVAFVLGMGCVFGARVIIARWLE